MGKDLNRQRPKEDVLMANKPMGRYSVSLVISTLILKSQRTTTTYPLECTNFKSLTVSRVKFKLWAENRPMNPGVGVRKTVESHKDTGRSGYYISFLLLRDALIQQPLT